MKLVTKSAMVSKNKRGDEYYRYFIYLFVFYIMLNQHRMTLFKSVYHLLSYEFKNRKVTIANKPKDN